MRTCWTAWTTCKSHADLLFLSQFFLLFQHFYTCFSLYLCIVCFIYLSAMICINYSDSQWPQKMNSFIYKIPVIIHLCMKCVLQCITEGWHYLVAAEEATGSYCVLSCASGSPTNSWQVTEIPCSLLYPKADISELEECTGCCVASWANTCKAPQPLRKCNL